jgi:hypothetical protein
MLDPAIRVQAIGAMAAWLQQAGVKDPVKAVRGATMLVDQAVAAGAGGQPGNS